jgi:D-glycero-alpha-D-manno-heptose-7-phosphate kinase
MRGVEAAISIRAPLRVALGGGGTDLPSRYREHGGFVVSAAIDRHVRMRVASAPPGAPFRLRHLEDEDVDDPALIRHPILRAAIARHGDGRPLELHSEGDVAPGTGLGSSGAYAVCAVSGVSTVAGSQLGGHELAEAACRIELCDMGRTVGKQDQYAAAHGGVNALTFERDGKVDVRPLDLGDDARAALRDRFLLFFTGRSRSAADVLAGQVERTQAGDDGLRRNLDRTEELARATAQALEQGRLDALDELMNEQWELKRNRLAHLPVPAIEELRERALEAGAHGAMLMGAGAGGYLLVYAPDPARVRGAMTAAGAPELSFGLDEHGCVAEPARGAG